MVALQGHKAAVEIHSLFRQYQSCLGRARRRPTMIEFDMRSLAAASTLTNYRAKCTFHHPSPSDDGRVAGPHYNLDNIIVCF